MTLESEESSNIIIFLSGSRLQFWQCFQFASTKWSVGGTFQNWSLELFFIGFAYQGKDVVFGFIIEYNSSLKDFGPY
jgi:hypothetical protein